MLAEQALQQGNLTVAGNFKELLFNRRGASTVSISMVCGLLHPAADRRDCRRRWQSSAAGQPVLADLPHQWHR